MALSTKQKIGLTGKHDAKQAMALLLPVIQHIFPGETIKRGRLHNPAHGIEDIYIAKGHARDTEDRLSIGFTRLGYLGTAANPGKMWVRVASMYGTSCVNFREFALSDLDEALQYLNAVDTYYKAAKELERINPWPTAAILTNTLPTGAVAPAPAPELTKTQRKARRVAEIMKLPVNQQAEAMMNLDKDTRQKRARK